MTIISHYQSSLWNDQDFVPPMSVGQETLFPPLSSPPPLSPGSPPHPRRHSLNPDRILALFRRCHTAKKTEESLRNTSSAKRNPEMESSPLRTRVTGSQGFTWSSLLPCDAAHMCSSQCVGFFTAPAGTTEFSWSGSTTLPHWHLLSRSKAAMPQVASATQHLVLSLTDPKALFKA